MILTTTGDFCSLFESTLTGSHQAVGSKQIQNHLFLISTGAYAGADSVIIAVMLENLSVSDGNCGKCWALIN
jgi:hypothetical protein